MKPSPFLIMSILVVAICVAFAGCTTTPTPGGTTPPTTVQTTAPGTTVPQTSATTAPSGGGGQVTISLVAKNIAFNTNTISVPAGSTVTVNFDNEDSGVPHNFAVYTSQAATTKIFSGQIITGVAQTTYTFTAPSTPGNYWFRCDVHPTVMYGTFTVT